jgi:hypothetical protein
VLDFYSELEDKIKEAEGKEFAGYTMQFFFKKVTKCADILGSDFKGDCTDVSGN